MAKPGMKWNEETQEWDRTEEYSTKIFLDAFAENVILDCPITFKSNGKKLKARAESVGDWGVNLQFPSALRQRGRVLIADVIEAKQGGFYRAYRGSIREGKEIVG